MNYHQSWPCLKTLGEVFLLFFSVFSLQADMIRTQSITLHKGWNAVYLQVDPTNSKPAACFQGTPVSIAASYIGVGPS